MDLFIFGSIILFVTIIVRTSSETKFCCLDNSKCISLQWVCDGDIDCPHGEDERDCSNRVESSSASSTTASIPFHLPRVNVKEWLLKQRNSERMLHKWGADLPRKAVAWYFADDSEPIEQKQFSQELAYELSSDFLSKLALRKIEDVKTADLGAYVNAFLISCIDPRQFYVLDLVAELRRRVNAMNSTSPFAVLSLCNAGETVTDTDVQKLLDVFDKAHNNFQTDLQAMTLLALSCAARQPQQHIDDLKLADLSSSLARKQSRNGTVENIKTTALTLQALYATGEILDMFDEKKALQQLLRAQHFDGSFGNLDSTYYVLPTLKRLSLINISSAHCPELRRNEKEILQYLGNQVDEKWLIKYSLLIGDSKVLQRTISLQVPKNISFYNIMQYAAGLDDHYKFDYNVRNRKPYIYSLSGFMNDPESELSWGLYQMKNEGKWELQLINKSPADLWPKHEDHLVFWYSETYN